MSNLKVIETCSNILKVSILEYWSDGVLKKYQTLSHHSNTPVLQYSEVI